MTQLAGLGFSAPWLLLALLALPILWIILRAVPPAPTRRIFPGVVLLLGLKDDDNVTDRTPWWLLLLRVLAVAAVIIGLAGPILNPQRGPTGSNPVLLVMDASWAGAEDWSQRLDLLETQATEIGRAGRSLALLRLSDPQDITFQAADAFQNRLPGLTPSPWAPNPALIQSALARIDAVDGAFDTLWLSDGLEYDQRDALLSRLQSRGSVTVFQSPTPRIGLRPASFQDGALQISATRSEPGQARDMRVLAMGPDPAGILRQLDQIDLRFEDNATTAQTAIEMPSELRARVTRFELEGIRSAGGVALSDDSLRRREIAMIASQQSSEGLDLLSPLHYLTQVLIPTSEFVEGPLLTVIPANPDVIILADVVALTDFEKAELTKWIEKGGLLLRFAGPHMAASQLGRDAEDPLLPVRLRGGGRSIGGAMSWDQAKTLAPFTEGSPFYGLEVNDEITVSSQVMAQPDPELADRVIASLEDGTALVTRKPIGLGQVVLFHVTANAEWSTLPLSGLFVGMLDRLAVSSAAKAATAVNLDGTTWSPTQVMNGFGTLRNADTLAGIPGEELLSTPLGPDVQPGVYSSDNRRIALNVLPADAELTPATWPLTVPVIGLTIIPEQPLAGLFLGLALLLLAIDILATLALAGRLLPMRVSAPVVLAGLLLALPQPGSAQTSETDAIAFSSELVLAHVLTGDKTVDDIAQAGLQGLSDTLFFRTSVEPSNPTGVDLERDELAFFPLLYWPITPDQPIPSDLAYAKLNAYLHSGGMILFDTRDADIARFGGASPNGRKLQRLARSLDIPPLEPLPNDHVLTRTFYLLQDFPGRHDGRDIWVEAAPPDAEQIEGMPFRNLNDGVTPVVIGGNDWAAAWATNRDGSALLPVGRGFSGERQRELAYRFGVNLVMHVLTGNYKSDQVHVPALLDRLGQ